LALNRDSTVTFTETNVPTQNSGVVSTISLTSAADEAPSHTLNGTESVVGSNSWRRAKVVCDYDATSKEEMSLMMNE
ncbi:hypothetical protein SK128_024746, partial [Halocaridina rubra]